MFTLASSWLYRRKLSIVYEDVSQCGSLTSTTNKSILSETTTISAKVIHKQFGSCQFNDSSGMSNKQAEENIKVVRQKWEVEIRGSARDNISC